MKEKKPSNLPAINEHISYPNVQVITHTGENLGVMTRNDALIRANTVNLDLVLLSPEGSMGAPVAKIMDFGKVLYERKKSDAKKKKNQKIIQVKEVKIRPKIGEHDFQTKLKQIIQFLKEGKRVKITLCFRGRENALKDLHGSDIFSKFEKFFDEHGLAKNIEQEGNLVQGQSWSRIYFLKNLK